MKFNAYAVLLLTTLNFSTAFASTCGSFTLNSEFNATGVITCTNSSNNIRTIEKLHTTNTTLTNITSLTNQISGMMGNTSKITGFTSFNANLSLTSTLNSAYMDLKQGVSRELFALTRTPDFGTWHTSTRNETEYSSPIQSGMNSSSTPIPDPTWIFGTGFLGLVGLTRKKNDATRRL